MLELDLTTASLDALRRSVALAHAVPGVATTIEIDGGPTVEARRPPLPEPTETRISVPVCWLRSAVASELATREADPTRIGSLDADIAVELHPTRTALPFSVVRFACSGRWVHATSIIGSSDDVRAAAVDVAEGTDHPGLDELSVHYAPDLGVAVLTIAVEPTEDASDLAANVLRTIDLRVGVAGVERALATDPAGWMAGGRGR